MNTTIKTKLLVLLGFVLLSTPLTATAGPYDDFIFETNGVTINVICYTGSASVVSIPGTISGLPVTSIGSWAFYQCYNLTSVTIPASVTNIGDHVFYYCTSLISVTIPNSVISIGDHAFRDCTSLTSVTIPANVTSIGDYTFDSCSSLTNATIGNSVISIGTYTFYYCTNLTSTTIGNSVTSIGYRAFSHCTGDPASRSPPTSPASGTRHSMSATA